MALHGRRILIVEDEGLLGWMTEDTLADAGATVIGRASTVAEALAVLQRDAGVEAAVLDLNLGGEMSAPVAEVLIEKQIPFVIATGYGTGMLRAVEERAGAVLVKPYDPPELVKALAALFRQDAAS